MISKCLKLGLLLVGVLALTASKAHAVAYSATDYSSIMLGMPVASAPTLHRCYDRDAAGVSSSPDPTCSGGALLQGEVTSNVYFNAMTGVYTYVYDVTPHQEDEVAASPGPPPVVGDTRFRGVVTSTSVPRPLGQLENSADAFVSDPPSGDDYSDLHVDNSGPLVIDDGKTGMGYQFSGASSVGGAGAPGLCTNAMNNCPSVRGRTDLTGQNVIFLGWTDPVTFSPSFGVNVSPLHWELGKEGATAVNWWNAGETVTLFWQTTFDNPTIGGLSFLFTGGTPGNPVGTVPIYVPGAPAAVVPEPGTLVLMVTGLGLVGLAGFRSRRKKVA